MFESKRMGLVVDGALELHCCLKEIVNALCQIVRNDNFGGSLRTATGT